eukprot:jgi/Bigna1/147014/aug1.126_g21722
MGNTNHEEEEEEEEKKDGKMMSATVTDNILSHLSCKHYEKDFSKLHFSAVLVDPPRAGLDEFTRKLSLRLCLKIEKNVATYPAILYISCNPEALKRDMKELVQSHRAVQFAFLDHFPYTKHVECAVYLIQKEEL